MKPARSGCPSAHTTLRIELLDTIRGAAIAARRGQQAIGNGRQ